jgi:hypothetical protein
MDIAIGSYTSPSDRADKFNAYKKLLIAQSNIQRRAELAFKDKLERGDVPYVRKLEEIPRFATTTEALLDVSDQQRKALANAREVLPRGSEAMTFLNMIGTGSQTDPATGEALNAPAVFNRYFSKLKERVKDRTVTPESLKKYYDRVLDEAVDDLIPNKKVKDSIMSQLETISNSFGIGIDKDKADELKDYFKNSVGLSDEELNDARRALQKIKDLREASRVVENLHNIYVDKTVSRSAPGLAVMMPGPKTPKKKATPIWLPGSPIEFKKSVSRGTLLKLAERLAEAVDEDYSFPSDPIVDLNGVEYEIIDRKDITKEYLKSFIDAVYRTDPGTFELLTETDTKSGNVLPYDYSNVLDASLVSVIDTARGGSRLGTPPSSPPAPPAPPAPSLPSGILTRLGKKLTPKKPVTKGSGIPRPREAVGVGDNVGLRGKRYPTRRIVIGGGLTESEITPNFYGFGKFRISREMLLDNVLSVYYRKWGRPSSQILKRNTPISETFKNLLFKAIKEKRIDVVQYYKLNADEKHMFKTLVSKAGLTDLLDSAFGNDGYGDEIKEVDEAAERFELVRGQILAGNNNPAIIKELVQLLDVLSKYDKITTYSRNKLMSEIVKIS